MKIAVKYILRSNEKSKELVARNVVGPSTTGFKVSGNGSVQNAVLGLLYEAEQ